MSVFLTDNLRLTVYESEMTAREMGLCSVSGAVHLCGIKITLFISQLNLYEI